MENNNTKNNIMNHKDAREAADEQSEMKKRNSFRQWLISEVAHLCESYRNASLEKRNDIISFFDDYIPTCESSAKRILTAIKEGLLAIK